MQVAIAVSSYLQRGMKAWFAAWKSRAKQSIRCRRISARCTTRISGLRKAAIVTAWHALAARNANLENLHRTKQRMIKAETLAAWQLSVLLNKAAAHWRAKSVGLLLRYEPADDRGSMRELYVVINMACC